MAALFGRPAESMTARTLITERKGLTSLEIAVSFLLLSGPLWGMQSEKPRISLHDVSAVVGEQVIVHLEVSGLEEEEVVHLKVKVQFPGDILNFVEAQAAVPNSELNVEASLESDGSGANPATLSIETDSSQAISPGEVMKLVFEISDQMFENQNFVMSILEASLETVGGEELQELERYDGNVSIVIPLFTCFFYMH